MTARRKNSYRNHPRADARYTPAEGSIHLRYAYRAAKVEGWSSTRDQFLAMKKECRELALRHCEFREFCNLHSRVMAGRRPWYGRSGHISTAWGTRTPLRFTGLSEVLIALGRPSSRIR